MSIATRRHTMHDLEQVRETTTDRVELIEGEIVVTPSPAPSHQDILGNIYALFRDTVRNAGLGAVYVAPLDVVLVKGTLAKDTIVQPDLVVVLPDRRLAITEKWIEGAPSLVVEIISPTTGVDDRGRKLAMYAQHGIPEYWLVDPDRLQVTIFTNPRQGRHLDEQTAIDDVVSVTIPVVATTIADVFSSGPEF